MTTASRWFGCALGILASTSGCGRPVRAPADDAWEIFEVRLAPSAISSGVVVASLLRNRSEVPRLVCVVGRVVMLGREFTTTFASRDACDDPGVFVLIASGGNHAFEASIALRPGAAYGDDGETPLATTLMIVQARSDSPRERSELHVSWEGVAREGYEAARRAAVGP